MEQIELDGRKKYEELTEELGRTQESTVENFIVMGFILKQVDEECLYRFDGYKNIYEYGKKKFGQSRSTVNRCKNINTKYSVGGNSRELRPEYRGYCRSTLQEMLDMSESDMELITAKTPGDQARELKKAIKEQQAIEKAEQENSLPLIQMAAEAAADGETQEQEPIEPLEAVLTSFWKKNMDLYRKVAAGLITPEIIAEEISPSGSMTYRDGVNIMFFYDIDKGLKFRSYAKGKAEITQYTYQELIQKTQELDPIQDQERGKQEPPQKEPVAAPQPDPEKQDIPYIPVPGQTSVSDLHDVMPDAMRESDEEPEKNQDNTATDNNNVIDGEYRELSEGTVQEDIKELAEGTVREDIKELDAGTEEYMYTDIEIKNAISFFDMEYSRMVMQQDAAKRRNYKIALECIRRCYKSVADNETGAGT